MEGGRIVLWLVTGNRHKLEEAREALRGYPVDLRAADLEKFEVQADSVEEVALTAARFAYAALRRPVVVDDTSLEIRALNGFPGVYANYVYRTIGLRGVLKLLEGVDDRRACFKTAVAAIVPPWEKVFIGTTCGVIVEEPRGGRGFGYDPIFAPEEGGGKTYAEMSLEEKTRVSHRGKAFRMLGEWIAQMVKVGGGGVGR